MGNSLAQKKKENNDHQTVAKVVVVALVGWGLTKLISSSSGSGSGSGSEEKMMKASKLAVLGSIKAETRTQEQKKIEAALCQLCENDERLSGTVNQLKDMITALTMRFDQNSSGIPNSAEAELGLEEELDTDHGHDTHKMMEASDGRLIRWRFPACGKLKMNTDGSVINSKDGFGGRAGFGGVIRDERGFCVMCFYGKLRDDCSILEAELWAICKGLKIIQGRNLREVEIESDSKEAINLIKNVKNDNMKEIRTMLLSTGCTLKHTLREGNRVADKLAKLGRDGDSNFISFTTPPKEIRSSLDADATSAGFVRGAR